MPGSVQAAAPTTVFPAGLSSAFSHSREWPVGVNAYQNGESQREILALSSRKRFNLQKRLTPSQLATFRSFYEARGGARDPFYLYYPWETNPKFSHDPTGAATVGRYTVRFDGAFEQTIEIGRAIASLELVEVA